MKLTEKINIFKTTKFSFDWTILFFRFSLSLQLIIVQGLKKVGIGTGFSESVPNPYHLPEALNY